MKIVVAVDHEEISTDILASIMMRNTKCCVRYDEVNEESYEFTIMSDSLADLVEAEKILAQYV